MNTMSISGSLLRILAITCFLTAPFALSQDDSLDYARELPSAYVSSSQQILAYNRAIKEAESLEGAYGASLSEPMLGLAQTLQSQGRHEEAIKIFKRGVHLTRINEGLYCEQQIPMLQGEIASHKAMQNYADADERQNYLYRVQVKSIGSSEALVTAFMQQARWQYDAYQIRLEQRDYERLINMWELYRVAFNDVIEREGTKSPNLLPPLYGMLQAQYLISGYPIPPSTPVFAEDGNIDESLLRFRAYVAKSYQRGNTIIKAISDLEQEDSAPDGAANAQTLVMLGDWRLWNGKRDAAWEAYSEAAMELARADDAQQEMQQVFDKPVALPAIAGIRPLPTAVAPNRADVTLAFGVSASGKVRDIERLDDNEKDEAQANRLIRQLRKTPFRPRIEAGQPVETEKLVKAFEIQ